MSKEKNSDVPSSKKDKKELQIQINALLERQRDLKALLNAVEISLHTDPTFNKFQTMRTIERQAKGPPAQTGIRINGQLSFRGKDKVILYLKSCFPFLNMTCLIGQRALR